MRDITFELCAETLAACVAARDGGAHRIELCSNLDAGGLTPAPELLAAAIAQTGLPIHAMVRPRAGSFFYTADEFASMRDSILQMKALGASGVVLGLLHPDHTVDVDRTRDLVRLARPVQVTFHRAFDETPDLSQALEDVITASCDRILTSGGQPDVLGGATTLAALVERASRRIVIAAGGGLRRTNAAAVARLTNAIHFHGSLRRKLSPSQTIIESEDVRDLIERLRNA